MNQRPPQNTSSQSTRAKMVIEVEIENKMAPNIKAFHTNKMAMKMFTAVQ